MDSGDTPGASGVRNRHEVVAGLIVDVPCHMHHVLLDTVALRRSRSSSPDPREDLESRSPNLGPYTTKGTL